MSAPGTYENGRGLDGCLAARGSSREDVVLRFLDILLAIDEVGDIRHDGVS